MLFALLVMFVPGFGGISVRISFPSLLFLSTFVFFLSPSLSPFYSRPLVLSSIPFSSCASLHMRTVMHVGIDR